MPDSFSLSLATPAGLAFLLALPVIAWLHLRRRRPRRMLVPSLTPWLVLAPSAPPRRRRVPPTVLLLLHLSAAACLALALAGPTVGGSPDAAADRAIVVDVSSSMAAGDRWAEALARVRALAGAARGAVSLVTLEARPRVLAARDIDGRAVGAALGDLTPGGPGGTGAATDEALALARAAAGPGADIVVVTDGAVPPPSPGLPAARWEIIGTPLDNLAVVDAAARTAGGETRLFARLASFGERAARAPLRLLVDGREIDRRTVDLAPGGTFETVWTLPAGARTAEVRVDAGDALLADNAASLPIERAGRRMQLSGDSAAVARALNAIPGAEIERVGLGNYHADGSVPLSVFAGAVPEVMPPGGVLLVNPPSGRLFAGRFEDASARIAAPGEHPLVAGLDLTGVAIEGLTDPELPDWAEPVLQADGMTAVFAGNFGESRVVAFAFDPDRGGIAERLAFPLLVARAIEWAAPEAALATVLAGDLAESDLRRRIDPGAIIAPDTQARPAPATLRDLGERSLWPWFASFALGLVLLECVWRARLAGRSGAGA
jgi:hypothetical protein